MTRSPAVRQCPPLVRKERPASTSSGKNAAERLRGVDSLLAPHPHASSISE